MSRKNQEQLIRVSKYQVGGSLSVNTSSYVVRFADHQLYQGLKQGEFCYVLNARQMGKSSLMVRTIHRLKQEGYYCSAVDMTRIGGERITPEQWYKGLIVELLQGFDLFGKINFQQWWRDRQELSPVQTFGLFIEEILLTELDRHHDRSQSPIVIFFDEIDSILPLNFSVNDFFALIRFCYNQRSINHKYQRLIFVLLGVATPSNLISDYQRTPFNIGKAINLKGFTLEEAQPLLSGLTKTVFNPEVVLAQILAWTKGQPFLTQKLCQLARDFPPPANLDSDESQWIDKLIYSHVINNWQTQDEPEHLKTIRDRLLFNKQKSSCFLTLYQQILQQGYIKTDDSIEQQELLLSGLIVKEKDKLRVCNPIYREVFNLDWVETQLYQLRPYSEALKAWQKSDCRDDSRLLRGKALEDAQQWSQGKSLSNLDYHFLTSSERLNRKEIQQALEAEKAREIEIRLIEKQRTSQLQRYLIFTLSFAFCSVLGFGIFAYKQYNQAKLNEIRALNNYSQALFASNKRLQALKIAIEIEQKRRKIKHLWIDTHTKQKNQLEKQIESVLRQSVYGIDGYNRLLGHDRTIFSVDTSSDGKHIVTAGEDQTVKLWQIDGTLVKTFEGHQAGVWDVAFSPKGKLIASASRDRTIKLWQTNGGLLKTIQAHQDEILGVRFSPNGKIIASASRDTTVKLWTLDGKLINTLEDHQGAVWRAVFSPDGSTLATVSEDKTIKLWQLDDFGKFQLKRTLKGHTNEIRNLTFNSTGKIIATVSQDSTIKLWQTDTGKLLHTLEGHISSVMGVAFTADDRQIITGSWDNTIKVWNLQGELLKTIVTGKKRIWDIALTPDDNTVVVVSENASLIRPTNPLLNVLQGHGEPVIDVAFSPDGGTIASISDDNTVRLWNDQGSLLTTLTHEDFGLGIGWSPNGRELAAGSWNGSLNFLQVEPFPAKKSTQPIINLQRRVKAHRVGLWRVVFSLDGKLIATIGEDRTAKLWDRQGNLITTFTKHQDVVRGLAISADSRIIATASYDRTVQLWNTQGKPLAVIEDSQYGMSAVAFSNDGEIMVTGNTEGTIQFWRIKRSPEKITLHLLETFTEHSDEIRKLAFSPDGQLIASASGDSTIKIWHRQGKFLKTFYGHERQVWSVAFSPDSKKLVSGSEDKTLIIWDLQQMFELDLLAAGCRQIEDYLRTNPNLSDRERSLCQEFISKEFLVK